MRSPDNKVRLDQGYYYQRGAVPSFRDRLLAAHYGIKAVDLIAAGQFGVAIGRGFGETFTVPLSEAVRAKPRSNDANYSILNKIANW